MNRVNSHLPIERFLLVTQAGHRQPDPVPKELMLAVALFLLTAFTVL